MAALIRTLLFVSLIVLVGICWDILYLHQRIDRLEERLAFSSLSRENERMVTHAAICNEINMRSRTPRQLSMSQCTEYMQNIAQDLAAQPTPTALERDTSRLPLGFEPTPCDPHVSLCTRINR
jgi:hypothetical protein